MQNVIVTGILIAVISIGSYLFINNDSSLGDTEESAVASFVANDQMASITLTPQEVTQSVFVDRIILEKPGYVSVREVINGKMGQILEVSDYLESGEHTNITIDLYDIPDENTETIVVLHIDNGDQGFNPSWDEVVFDGDQVVARYTRTGELVETAILAPNQNTSDAVAATVRYTDGGFEPKTVAINLGETVRFINESSGPMWVASDPHPSHLILSTFDQFGISQPGEIYEYQFDGGGEWAYHDHINASFEGVVTVN